MAPRAPILDIISRRRAMANRHFGFERAKATAIGREHDMDYRSVHAELRRAVCKRCARAVCHHSDLEYSGLVPHDDERP